MAETKELTVLQIWAGSEPNELEAERMAKTRKLGNYVLLDDESLLSYVEHSERLAPLLHGKGFHPQRLSELVRFDYAAHNRNVLYVDCDCEVLSLPKFTGEKPYFARWGKRLIDSFLFYANNLDFFRQLTERVVTQGMRKRGFGPRVYDGNRVLCAEYRDNVNVIEKGCFIHGCN